jgi:hypothetical protein
MSKLGWKKKEPFDDEFAFESPKLLDSIINEQIIDNNSFRHFFDAVRLPIKEIESLCSLREGFFSAYYLESEMMEKTTYSSFGQLSLFQEGGISYA